MKAKLLSIAMLLAGTFAFAATVEAGQPCCATHGHRKCGHKCGHKCCHHKCGHGPRCCYKHGSNGTCVPYGGVFGEDGSLQSAQVQGNPGNVFPWHGGYYHVQYGAPLALVVPPTARRQINYGWGVGNSRITPIYHQFSREYPGVVGESGYGFRPTPRWPSDTTQFGVYYVRGPW